MTTMKASLATLAELVPGLPADAVAVAERMSRAGLEVLRRQVVQGEAWLVLKLPPHRPDLRSHAGLARELAALYGRPMPEPGPRGAATHEPRVVSLRPQRLARLVGMPIERDEIIARLARLGIHAQAPTGALDEPLRLEVPAWRPDLVSEVDLVEEVIRVHELDALPSIPPRAASRDAAAAHGDPEAPIRRALVDAGLVEVIHVALTDLAVLRSFGSASDDDLVRVANALPPADDCLRASLLPGLVHGALRRAGSRSPLALFELGRVFAWELGSLLPRQPRRLGLAWRSAAPASPAVLDPALDAVVRALGLGPLRRMPHRLAWSTEPGGVRLCVGERVVGTAGVLRPERMGSLGIDGPVPVLAELDLDACIAAEPP